LITMRSRVRLGLTRLRPALPVVVIASLLALLPFPTCLLRLALGVPCPACGLTRATLAAARLDWSAALRWHPLSLPLLAITALTATGAFVIDEAAWRRLVTVVTGAAGVALILVWVLRFAGLFGGPVPG
jgi:hypothetical protein